ALNSAGFSEIASDDHTPPITQYRLRDGGGFYVEFVVPLRGSEAKRGGKVDLTAAIAGVTAQKLRYLDLLLVQPWAVRLGENVGVPLEPPIDVMLPNPTSFIAQKILIRSRRTAEKQAQDALYIHDTLELFSGELPALRTLWREVLGPTLPRK